MDSGLLAALGPGMTECIGRAAIALLSRAHRPLQCPPGGNERMSDWKDREVIIVGGGIGGLAAALALARNGIASQIIEQATEFKEIGAGIQLGPNVFWMFEVLGLVAPIS